MAPLTIAARRPPWWRVLVRPWFLRAVCIAVVLGLPLWRAADGVAGAAFLHRPELFGFMLGGPVSLVLPLVVVVLFCSTSYAEISARYIANTRSREDIRFRMALRIGRSAFSAALVAGGYVLVAVLVAFVIWPAIGDPAIDAVGSGLSPSDIEANALTSNSYAGLLRFGEIPYGLFLALMVGVAGAAFAALGEAFLLLVSNRILAIALPFLIYLGSTIVAAVVGYPYAGLLYALFPSGLVAIEPLQAAIPVFALYALALVLGVWVVVRSPRNKLLS